MKLIVDIVDSGCDMRLANIENRVRRHIVRLALAGVASEVRRFGSAQTWLAASCTSATPDMQVMFIHASNAEPGWQTVVETLARRLDRNQVTNLIVVSYSGSRFPANSFAAGKFVAGEIAWWRHYGPVKGRWDSDSPEQASRAGLDPDNPPVEGLLNELLRGGNPDQSLNDSVSGARPEEARTSDQERFRGLRHSLLNAVGPLRQATDFALATGAGVIQFRALWNHLVGRVNSVVGLPIAMVDTVRRCEHELVPKLGDGQADKPALEALARELALIEAFATAVDRPPINWSAIEGVLSAEVPAERVRILWIDDEEAWFDALKPLMTRLGIDAEHSASPETRLASMNDITNFDAIVLDLILEGHGEGVRDLLARHGVTTTEAVDDSTAGICLLQLIQTLPQPPATFILSARDSPSIVRACTMHGARNYFVKGRDDQLRLLIELQREAQARKQRFTEILSPRNPNLVIGSDDPLANVVLRLHRIGSSKLGRAVLLVGEPGTGKEELATEFHLRSSRRTGPFKTIDCTNIVAASIESELFGHKRGAFTDAIADRAGLIEQAEGGVVFIDEVDKLSPDHQNRLLRFIETGIIRRFGDDKDRRVDALVVLASNANPAHAAAGTFSEPFVSRLQSFTFQVPPVRERLGAIEDIAKALCVRLASREDRFAPKLLAPALQWLRTQAANGRFDGSGGNIRGIRNLLARALIEYPDQLEFGRADLEKIANEETVPSAGPSSAFRKAARIVIEALSSKSTVKLQEISDGFEAALLHSVEVDRGSKRAAEFFGWSLDNLRQYRKSFRDKGLWPSKD